MTRDWDPDWGGLLQFYDAEKNVEQVFVPRFNTLSLFTVPQSHAVSAVAPYAPVGRLAITRMVRRSVTPLTLSNY